MNLKKIIAAGATCLGLYMLYDYNNYTYPTPPPTKEYKSEFQTDVKKFSGSLENRIFPKNAKHGKTVDITLFIDAELKRVYDHPLWPGGENDWQEELESSLEIATKPFYDEFGLSFKVTKLNYWDPFEQDSLLNLLYELDREETGTFAKIGITGKDTVGNLIGLTAPPNPKQLNTLTTITAAKRWKLYKTLQHEMSHWFLAVDYELAHISIMDYFFAKYTNQWDETNKSIIKHSSKSIIQLLEQQNLKTTQDPK